MVAAAATAALWEGAESDASELTAPESRPEAVEGMGAGAARAMGGGVTPCFRRQVRNSS